MNPPAPGQGAARGDKAWTVSKSKDGCIATLKVDCPQSEPGKPRLACNPPPPTPYTCPQGVPVDPPITVVTYADACRIDYGPPRCAPSDMCNPPPPRKVPCPK
jgi:hypothetical protein